MRGGAQAQLIEGDDGHYYVVKTKDNPQHRRILVNEWIAAVFLRYLQIAGPEAVPMWLDEEFIAATPELAIQLGRTLKPISPGWHFASRMPGDPAAVAVYDTLPAVLVPKVANLRDLAGILVFDRWTANADYRQAIYFRAQVAEPGVTRPGFVIWPIDHGFIFQGPHWNLKGAPAQGIMSANPVYASLRNAGELEPWLTRMESFPESVVDQALASMPREWLAPGEDEELERLLEQLLRHRARLRRDVDDALRALPQLFPHWPR